jgi:UDP-glucose 4-epimerase
MDVDDTTDAVMELMEAECWGEVYNIGASRQVSIEELAQKIIDLTGSSSEIKYIPYEEAYESGFEDMRHRVPDTTKLEEKLDFRPKYELDDILKRIIDFFRSNEGFQ